MTLLLKNLTIYVKKQTYFQILMSFLAGQTLKNPEWSKSLSSLRDLGVYYPPWVSKTVKNGVDCENPAYYNSKTEKLMFNGKLWKTWESLDTAYPRGFNYDSINKMSDETKVLIETGLEQQSWRKLSASEIEDPERVFNPLHCVFSGKPRLILHTKMNARYTSPSITLPRILLSTTHLRAADSMVTHDLKSAYYQLHLNEKSRKMCSFWYNGEGYEYLVLPFGYSAAVVIAQTIFNIPADVVRFVKKRRIWNYIDDFAQELQNKTDEDFIKPELLRHGLILSDKSTRGTEVVFLGIFLDLERNVFRLKTSTLQKIHSQLSQSFSKDGSLWFCREQLEKLLGLLNFASECCITLRTNCSHLISCFRKASANGNGLCSIDEHCYKELLFWRRYCDKPDQKPFDSLVPVSLQINSSSDASLPLWSYRDSENLSGNGRFPALLVSQAAADIMPREGYGINQYLEVCKNGLHILHVCDNKPFVNSYKKGRSNNLYSNKILRDIYELCYLKNIKLDVEWCSTSKMAELGTDGLSRNDFSCIFDNASLTSKGALRLEQIYGSKPIADCFASHVNNPFQVQYASRHRFEDDPKYLRLEGQEFLSSHKFTEMTTQGYFFIWPPLELMEWTVAFLLNRSHFASLSCVLVVPGDRSSIVYQNLLGYENVHQFSLQKPKEKSHTVNCKNTKGLSVVGFGPLLKPDLSYRKHLHEQTATKNAILAKKPRINY